MSSTPNKYKTTLKFIKITQGKGPSCYPDELGTEERAECIEECVRKTTKNYNVIFDDLVVNKDHEDVHAHGLLGKRFSNKKYYADSKTDPPAMLAAAKNEAKTKRKFQKGYNKQNNINHHSIPQKVKNERWVDNAEARGVALASRPIPKMFYACLSSCFCYTGVFEQCITHGWKSGKTTWKENTGVVDGTDIQNDGSVIEDEDENGDATPLGGSIPIVIGQYKLRTTIIEKRSESELVVGVCQADPSLKLLRMWFNDKIVYDNGAFVTSTLLGGVSFNPHRYKDLYTINLHDVDVKALFFKYQATIYVEVAQNAVQTNEVVTVNNTEVVKVNRKTGFVAYRTGATGVTIRDGAVFPEGDYAASIILNPASVLNPVDGMVYYDDKKVDPYSGAYSTLPYHLTGPIGVASDGTLITNTFLVSSGVKYTLSPPSSAATYVSNYGVAANGSQLYVIDTTAHTTTTHDLQHIIAYDCIVYHTVKHKILLINSVTGDINVINTAIGNVGWEQVINLGFGVVKLFNGVLTDDSSVAFVRRSDNQVFYFDISNYDVTTNGIVLPNTFTQVAKFGSTFIGTEAGGQLREVTSSFRGDATTTDIVSHISDFTSDAEPVTGYLVGGDKSMLSYLLNVAYAYNMYLYNNGGTGYLSSQAVSATIIDNLVLQKEQLVHAQDNVSKKLTFAVTGIDYLPLAVEVDTTSELSNFSTSMIMSVDKARVFANAFSSRVLPAQNYHTKVSPYYHLVNAPGFDIAEWSFDYGYIDMTTNDYFTYPVTYAREDIVYGTTVTLEPPDYTLPPFFTSLAGVGEYPTVPVSSAKVGYTVNSLTNTRHSYRTKCKDEELYIKFNGTIPPLHASVDFLDLVEDRYLNLVCIGDEWVQYRELEVVNTNTVKLTGLLRGRFITSSVANHAANERAVFYDADTFTLTNADDILHPTTLPVIIQYHEYLFGEFEDGTVDTFSSMLNLAPVDPKNYDIPYPIPYATYKTHWVMYLEGEITDICDVFAEYWWSEDKKCYVKIEYLEDYSSNSRLPYLKTKLDDYPDPTEAELDEFYKFRGDFTDSTDRRHKKYTLTRRKFEGVLLHIVSPETGTVPRSDVELFLDGASYSITPVMVDSTGDCILPGDFNPFVHEVTYAIL